MRNISGETVILATLVLSLVFLFCFLVYMGVTNSSEKFRVCIENGNQYIEGSCIPITKDF